MASYFSETRNVELSILYFLEQNLNADWTGTTVCKTFKQVYSKDVSLPIVAVRLQDTSNTRKELGATTLEKRYLIILDIFSTSDGMRLDLSHYIREKLKEGWDHYAHSHPSGSTTTLSRSVNGYDMVTEWVTDARIDAGQEVDDKDRFRHNISIRVRHSQ